MRIRFVGYGLLAAIGIAAIGMAWLAVRSSRASRTVRPGITVLVNHQPRIEVIPGTPLMFQASLSSSPMSGAFSVGSRWRAWHTLLRLEGIDSGGRPVSWVRADLSTPRSIHVIEDADRRPDVTEDTASVARFDAGRHVHTVMLAVGPDETAAIPAGMYRFRVVLETPFWLFWGWGGRAVSSAATIVVRDPSRPDTHIAQLEATRLTLAADFYLNAGRFADAHRLAQTLTTIKPKDSRSHMQLGDALVGMNRQQEALAAYRIALALRPPSYEEPTLLMDRIQLAIESARR
jgi:hypothetical protein